MSRQKVRGLNLARWLVLSSGVRASSKTARYALVIHTEGLINGRTSKVLAEFGRGLNHAFRPVLATITPFCPMYQEDPLLDWKRLDFPVRPMPERTKREFAERLQDLSVYYDIGYHGHFFKAEANRFTPSFDHKVISSQMRLERGIFSEIGFAPAVYAGGWWYLDAGIVSLLASFGFKVDTTLNDVRLDTFSRSQPFPPSEFGRPFPLTTSVLEVPSVKSASAMVYRVPIEKRGSPLLLSLFIHDYDLASEWGLLFKKLLMKLPGYGRFLSTPDLIRASKSWLQKQPAPATEP